VGRSSISIQDISRKILRDVDQCFEKRTCRTHLPKYTERCTDSAASSPRCDGSETCIRSTYATTREFRTSYPRIFYETSRLRISCPIAISIPIPNTVTIAPPRFLLHHTKHHHYIPNIAHDLHTEPLRIKTTPDGKSNNISLHNKKGR
jgi:hypothetical protein